MKNPYLALLLNIIPFGWGYVYLAEFLRFLITVAAGVLAAALCVAYFVQAGWSCMWADCTSFPSTPIIVASIFPSLLVIGFSALDAFVVAKRINPEGGVERSPPASRSRNECPVCQAKVEGDLAFHVQLLH